MVGAMKHILVGGVAVVLASCAAPQGNNVLQKWSQPIVMWEGIEATTLPTISRSSCGRYVRRQETTPSNSRTKGIIGTKYVQSNRDQRNGRIHGVQTNSMRTQANTRPMVDGACLVTSNMPILSLASTAFWRIA